MEPVATIFPLSRHYDALGSLGLLLCHLEGSMSSVPGPPAEAPVGRKGIHCAPGLCMDGSARRPAYAAPITPAVPVWPPTSKLPTFLNMHSEFYFPMLQTMQFPKSAKGQAFIPGLKEYALGSFPFLFSFGEVIKTALIISKQPTFS